MISKMAPWIVSRQILFAAAFFLAMGSLKLMMPRDAEAQLQYAQQQVRILCSSWIATRDSRYALSIEWPTFDFEERPCSTYTPLYVDRVKFVINRLWSRQIPLADLQFNIYPPAPILSRARIEYRKSVQGTWTRRERMRVVGLGPPIGDALPGGWRYHFEVHRVPERDWERVLSALHRLDRSELYGRYRGPLGYRSCFDRDDVAHYTRVYDLSGESALAGIQIPALWEQLLEGEGSKKLWVEAAIPIAEDWTPVGYPIRRVLPIAMQTPQGLFLISQEVRAKRWAGGSFPPISATAFDLSNCPVPKKCFESVMDTVKEVLPSVFERAPLLVSTTGEAAHPRQFRFHRKFKKSEVLSGVRGPYYELSTYTLLFWRGWPPQAELNRRDKRKDQVFLEAVHALQVAVGRKGDYQEPTPEQYALYQEALQSAIESTVKEVTRLHEGQVSGAVGEITRPRGEED